MCNRLDVDNPSRCQPRFSEFISISIQDVLYLSKLYNLIRQNFRTNSQLLAKLMHSLNYILGLCIFRESSSIKPRVQWRDPIAPTSVKRLLIEKHRLVSIVYILAQFVYQVKCTQMIPKGPE